MNLKLKQVPLTPADKLTPSLITQISDKGFLERDQNNLDSEVVVYIEVRNTDHLTYLIRDCFCHSSLDPA